VGTLLLTILERNDISDHKDYVIVHTKVIGWKGKMRGTRRTGF